jgi:hypothetical protein
MSDKIPYSLLRISIPFVPSNSLKTVASDHSTSEEEDKEKLARSITKFYQSVISLPPAKKKKVRKNKVNITCKKQQGIINNRTITKNNILENCCSQSNLVSTDNESFSNSLAKLLEYNDSDEEDIKHIESIEDTTKIVNNNEYEGKFNSNDDNKIWCVDCEVWVEKHLYQSHIHGVAHLVISKSFNNQPIPDPLTLNEVNN